jgi:hypothetical protein
MKMAKTDYTQRKAVNEKSRNEAVANAERWSAVEVETLETLWTTDEEDLIALAALLGRTVEACRQKHYDLSKQPERVAVEKVQQVSKWSKGFTSLESMGY